MRRLVPAIVLLLGACAMPSLELVPRFPVGIERVYLVTIDATTDIDVPGAETVERTLLEARSTLEVTGTGPDGNRVALTLEPVRWLRDGVEEERATQRVELIVADDGSVTRVVTVDGLPADVGGAVDDLAPLLGLSLPAGELRLGERWRRSLPDGEQTGRIGAVRAVAGYDAAIVVLGQTRTLRRQTQLDVGPLVLAGTEHSAGEVAFALGEGFPVRIETSSEGRFEIEGAGPGAGTVLIRARTVLELESAGPRAG